jgi:uncharacterized protein (TIGR02172 family)
MASVTKRIENDTLYLELTGRIDTSNADKIEQSIQQIRTEFPAANCVLDAEKLEFISSAGLRIILRLLKELKQLKIINVNSEVYEIFDMTGFTDMLTVEKAFRKISIDGCELIARGGNGCIYRYDEETIVKTYHNGAPLEEIRQEKELCRKVFVKGINTAIPYDVVKVGDSYGSVAEMLSAKSVAKILRANPEKLDECMDIYTDLLKKIHSTPIADGEMPSMKEVAVNWIKDLESYLPQDQWTKLLDMMKNISEPKFMIHGDYHINNVMIQDGEPLLIDMDTVAYGHPIFEFAAIYLGYVGYCEANHSGTMDFYGLPYETTNKLWATLLEKYFNGDKAKMQEIELKAKIIGYARMLRRTIRRVGKDTEEGKILIELCKNHLTELLPLVDTLEC